MSDCQLGKVVDDGYDPRGSTTDYYRAGCTHCSAEVSWGVGHRDDYGDKLIKARRSLKNCCGKPEAVSIRKKNQLITKIAEMEKDLENLKGLT